MILYGVVILGAYAAVLAFVGTRPWAVSLVLAVAAAHLAITLWARRPTASGAPPQRPAVVTDPGVPPPSARDLPLKRRTSRLRAVAALLVIVVCAWVAANAAEAAFFPAVVAAMGLVNVDLPWLWDVRRRIDRGGLTRVSVTVRAVGVPGARRLMVSSQTMAWLAQREGVLYEAVVGDVLMADVDPKDGTPMVLTLGKDRSLAPAMFRVTPDRFRILVGEHLVVGNEVV